FRTENALAEQAVLFGAVGAIVDRLRLLDFAERPAPDVVGAGQADANRAVIVDAVVIGCVGGCGGGSVRAHMVSLLVGEGVCMMVRCCIAAERHHVSGSK